MKPKRANGHSPKGWNYGCESTESTRKMQTKIIRIDPRKLKLLEVNARFMRHEVFMQLTENIKKDRALTSVPFCAIYQYFNAGGVIPTYEDGTLIYEVLSGNHR